MKAFISSVVAGALVLIASSAAFAQSVEAARTVGRKGAKQVGINFATNTSITSSGYGTNSSMTNLFGGLDVGRFVSDKFLTRFGISGSGNVGGGSSSVSFSLLGGGLFYFTPEKPQSLYIGGDMTVPLSSQGTGDPYVNGRLGIQAALRANAALFFEGGYGTLLSRDGGGMNGSLQTNVGIRILF